MNKIKGNTKYKILISLLVIIIATTGFFTVKRVINYLSLNAVCKEVTNILNAGNYEKLLVENNYSKETIESYNSLTGENLENNNKNYALINTILSHSRISGKTSLFKNAITFEIKAPNMKKCIEKLKEDTTSENYKQLFDDYLKNGEKITMTIKMNYSKKNKKWKTEYSSSEFLNAITGGFIDGYSNLYFELENDMKELSGD